MSESKKPLPLNDVRRLVNDPKTTVVMASRDVVEALNPYVARVLTAVKTVFGVAGDVWVSDESCLSDFFEGNRDRSQDQLLYDQVGEKLGIPLDRADDDDHSIVKIALKLKKRESATNC